MDQHASLTDASSAKLENYVKYCLGFARIVGRDHFSSRDNEVALEHREHLDLQKILIAEEPETQRFNIYLPTFTKYAPRNIPKEHQAQWESEKEIAVRLGDLYNSQKNDEFTKQLSLSFGYIDLPVSVQRDHDGNLDTSELRSLPLFSIPVRLIGMSWIAYLDEKTPRQQRSEPESVYNISLSTDSVQVNIDSFLPYLSEASQEELYTLLGQVEVNRDLYFPLSRIRVLTSLWKALSHWLKIADVQFSDRSFKLKRITISIRPRANYFLTEDLKRLSKGNVDCPLKTSLSSLVEDEGLVGNESNEEVNELFFPLPYDKFQRRVTSGLSSKAIVIEGPPGTGKSQTIANLCCHLTATGNHVLFVSQKPQALKVVKDILKDKVNLEQYFGYLPDSKAAVLDENDVLDGVGNQLGALESYIEDIEFSKAARGEEQLSNESQKDDCSQQFNEALAAHRHYFRLHKRRNEIELYDIEVMDINKFRSAFQQSEYLDIQRLESEQFTLEQEVKEYEQANSATICSFQAKLEMPEQLDAVNLSLSSICRDLHATLGQDLNKLQQWLRLRAHFCRTVNERRALPRNVSRYIIELCRSEESLPAILRKLEQLRDFSKYKANAARLEVVIASLSSSLLDVGLTERQYRAFKELETASNFENTKANVLEMNSNRISAKRLILDNPNNLWKKHSAAIEQEHTRISQRIQNRQNVHLRGLFESEPKLRRKVRSLAKKLQKSKRAFRTFAALKDDPSSMRDLLQVYPLWIMELDDASRLLPLEPGIFDYVIFDEASQCSIAYALPSMYRARRAIFFGDSLQMRDDSVMFKSNQAFIELSRKYSIPDDMQIKNAGSSVQSALEIVRLRGFRKFALRMHYRSPKELIGFSNANFYKPANLELTVFNNKYITFEDTRRIMLVHNIENCPASDVSISTNEDEANYIVKLVQRIRSNELLSGRSIGILSFFNEQASLIRTKIEKSFPEDQAISVSIVEGIQGDEKDIIIFSFVIKSPTEKSRYVPLTGEGGDIRKDICAGRVNVAFSRARLQVHCVVSLPPDAFPSGIWLKKYLEYVEKNGLVELFDTTLAPFESKFEEEFYFELKEQLPDSFIIRNQVPTCGFRPDFVIINTSNAKSIIVECDGPTHFEEGTLIRVESDIEREILLRMAGWDLLHVTYSDWINYPKKRGKYFREIISALA